MHCYMCVSILISVTWNLASSWLLTCIHVMTFLPNQVWVKRWQLGTISRIRPILVHFPYIVNSGHSLHTFLSQWQCVWLLHRYRPGDSLTMHIFSWTSYRFWVSHSTEMLHLRSYLSFLSPHFQDWNITIHISL